MWSPPAAQARAKTLAEESTPLPCGPPIIQERSFTRFVAGLMRSHHPDTEGRALFWGFPFSFAGENGPDNCPIPGDFVAAILDDRSATHEGRRRTLSNLSSRFRSSRIVPRHPRERAGTACQPSARDLVAWSSGG